ncbi:MAG: sulfatase-like hydrolase/transferase [Verrucomicrobiota bacterium JB023]|nr:sulfatase-like hydrolase/transferase [Verrucomicrobiota bacterium JB023]
MKKRNLIIRLISACLLALPAAAADRPNIVIFLADDLGYGDLGSYGNQIIQTPHLDQLADDGVRLLDCHSAGTVCSPSRAGLLTGRTPYRTGFYTIAGPEKCHLRKEEITLPSLLKEEGYDTCFVGKWHLGRFKSQPDPGDHGFDHWFATEVNAFDGPEDTDRWVRNGEAIGKTGQWYCDAIVKEAQDWIANRKDQERPYFLVVSYHEPHTPIHPPKEYSDLYDNERTEMLESTVAYGQYHRPFNNDISGNKKYYYGTVTQLDASVGRLLKAIDDRGEREESVIIFTSDNGPETPVTVEESNNQWEDPIRDRCFGSPGPWRGMKRYVYEGGHRVPGLVRWPGKVEPGSISASLVNGTDWLPTLCSAVGIEVPDDRTIDGVDALPALQGQDVERPIPACWTYPVNYNADLMGSMAVRDGNFVIIGWFEPKPHGEDAPGYSEWIRSTPIQSFELYDLSIDTSQSAPLNEVRPEKFEMMKAKMLELWSGIQKDAPDWPSYAH